ncbi:MULTISPECIES: GNAT family N-acetyltransferase [unclassified Minwuia]|uniref:GNAT family N-acetyltransferase n=1 Tax=unclassified Minwuia TaxID=2618799 RepID=UPI0024799AFE|nr:MULTISPECIES: GNAT family N-acetyltransferase [unclassified Minwuia]
MSGPVPSFRPATAADVAAIVGLLADDQLGAAREDASLPLDERYIRAFDAIDRDPNQMQVVADLEGQVVGCLQLSFIPGLSFIGTWRGQIESVRIHSSMRGSGLGQQMITWAVGVCRERGCGLVQLSTHQSREDAVRFYEKLGFTNSHFGMKLSLDT